MKTNVALAASLLLISFFGTLASQAHQSKSIVSNAKSTSGILQFTISIPESIQPEITRVDYENQSIFSFKNEGGKSAFLFSVNKVTAEQWLAIKSSVKNYTILQNQDGYITFIEKTQELSIKGKNNAAYQQIYSQLDAIISSIKM